MKAESMVIIDGQTYHKGDEIPDLGSLVGSGGTHRSYEGLYSDKDKLPHYPDLETGSEAMLIEPDTGLHYFKYVKSTDTWYEC